MKYPRLILALGAFFVLGAGISACGGTSVPGNSVADMAGNPITLQAFNHWMYVAAKGSTQSPSQPVIVPNDPPNFNNCIAAARKAIPSVASQTTAQLRSECSQLFSSLSSQVMQFLIQSYWYQAEAANQHVNVTNAQVQQEFNQERAQQFQTEAEFQSFLTQTGETLQDILYRVRVNLILQRLVKQQTAQVTPAAIQAYYNSHKSTYGSPETRNIQVVLAKTPADADAAKKALASGQSWAAVAKQYSIDPTTKNNGGSLVGVTKGQQDAALDNAAFAAPVNKVLGPVKGQLANGYYVFEVTKINPSTQQTLAQATPQIKQQLTTQGQSSAQSAVDNKVKKTWQGKTSCRAEYAMSDCNGYKAPKSSSTTTAPSTSSTG
ncbi:MAG: peptidyl-prolyl cis-trans isomerase [Solirubrobacterales bacterium]|nr:peptidyl-prolyl cis-trans isomerase [Solirubrobacterales bacterium]